MFFFLPERYSVPVQGASARDWNPQSFWYYPWGRSVVHKGIDIFAEEGRAVVGATSGLVIYKGTLGAGGNVLLVLGPKWRLHYYAHLKQFRTGWFSWVSRGKTIGETGTTGNARGKPPHLHYSIITPVPYITRWDGSRRGWMKMFYLNPDEKLRTL